MHKTLIVCLILAGTVSVVGCGQKELPMKKTYPVQGKVQYNGEPVTFAILNLEPKDGKGFPAVGYTDKEGNITGLRSFSNNEMDGAVPGDYELTVECYNPINAVKYLGPKPAEGEKPSKLPPEATSKSTSVTIDASDSNQLNVEL